MEDGAVLPQVKGKIVMTTDSFVVSPIFFSGGDIGKLSICGTVNDLTAMAARPLYITTGFIIEEGFGIDKLENILKSMKQTADEAGVSIIAGDTKVVERGKADGIYINTTGIGVISVKTAVSVSKAGPGDAVIVTGALGEHEAAILKERQGLSFKAAIKSDCAPLYSMIATLISAGIKLKVMRDPTRGGLAAVLNEIAESSKVNIRINEEAIPENKTVRAACSLFGFEPVYMANEGKMAIICAKKDAAKAIMLLKKSKYGKKAAVIGSVTAKSKKPTVIMATTSGGERILLMPEGEQLPRIC